MDVVFRVDLFVQVLKEKNKNLYLRLSQNGCRFFLGRGERERERY
jgi:hypothetical protein